jgi:hypothetical protein
VFLYVRYARPHLYMDFSLILLSDACASKVTPKLGKMRLITDRYWSCTSNRLLPVTVYIIISRYYKANF